jgi:hypothetical protein
VVAGPRIELGTRGFSEGLKDAAINDFNRLSLPNFAKLTYLRSPFTPIYTRILDQEEVKNHHPAGQRPGGLPQVPGARKCQR